MEDAHEQNSFQLAAEKTRQTVGNKDLNPKPISWKERLARVAAAGAAAAGLYIGGKTAYEHLTNDPGYYGKPFGDGIPIITDLIKVDDNRQELIGPTYRSKPTTKAEELSEEELRKRGFDPQMIRGVIIQEVKGGTYSGNPIHGKGRVEDEDGKEIGVWGEILLPKLGGEIGEYKRTGIFVSENFIDQESSEKVSPNVQIVINSKKE